MCFQALGLILCVMCVEDLIHHVLRHNDGELVYPAVVFGPAFRFIAMVTHR